MNLERAVSEPFIHLLAFHNLFNRNIKFTFGALAELTKPAKQTSAQVMLTLGTGGEPWGPMKWRTVDADIKNAAVFLSELGLARAASAFEAYLIGAKAEFDRANGLPTTSAADGDTKLDQLIADLAVPSKDIHDAREMVRFYTVARNCVVHRSNRANRELFELRQSDDFKKVLAAWSKRVGKWTVSVPDVQRDSIVDWMPRHAIMASDAFYRCGVVLDKALLAHLGPNGIVNMAAHWTYFAENPVPCEAKHSPENVICGQLTKRYNVQLLDRNTPVRILRDINRWDSVYAAFSANFPAPKTKKFRKGRVADKSTR